MSKKQEKLTQEEIWDDSALIDSWNEALQEYKVTFMLRAEVYGSWSLKIGKLRPQEVSFTRLTSERRAEAEAESGSEQPQVTETEEIELESGTAEQNKDIPSSRNESKEPIASQGTPSFPIQTVLGSVQDESLKKLLMSWYYAGYYTGLYEGQQQAQQK
ncbi:Survival motor neuron 1 [Fusarium tjaetaba]|uniref:Survival motor neuron 1 n=1 Tax=Fusarium tjaetaba TaxID=1567544 RepID=A0A8H5W940_9HYPO|nr:Survival motor neuron 1 [Fusarium tjaetaba]KAF5649743.1 Survival motor neuron 1 [Fusarium tjaetaba]